MSKYFSVPHDSLIGLPPPTTIIPTGDYHFAHDRLRFWAQADQGSRQVVVMLFEDDEPVYALDGDWRQQLESCTGGCNGGGPGPTPGAGAIRTAYGGMIASDPFGYTEILFPVANEWVILDGGKMNLLPYDEGGTDEYSYNIVDNSMTLSWDAPAPASKGYTQGTVVWSVAATGNDQTYAFTWIVDGVPASKQGEVYLINERGGDIETLVQQGHREIADGTTFQLAIKNVGGTNRLRLYGLNWRMVSSNQDEPLT